MSAYFVIFSKVRLPEHIKGVLDMMEKEDCVKLAYIEKDGTIDDYRSHMKSVADNLGMFAVYDGFKSKNGKDCLTWYVLVDDSGLLSDVDSSWYLLREFTLGFSGPGELIQYADEEGIFVAPEDSEMFKWRNATDIPLG